MSEPKGAPNSVMFWSGAGISGDAPSCLPLGDQLTEVIVTATCSEASWTQICSLLSRIDMRDESGRRKLAPRLEAVVEQLDRRANGRISDALGALGAAEPNDLHRFFASHIAHGGAHVTMNIDDRIETCCRDMETTHRPLALHGHVGGKGEESVRLRVSSLTVGLHPRFQDRIERRLRDGGALIFLGYSGRDYFDVDPFFRSLQERDIPLTNLHVIWVAHAPGRSEPESVLDWEERRGIDGRPILQSLADLGARVSYEWVDTRVFLHELARDWPFAPPRLPTRVPDCPHPSEMLDEIARRLESPPQQQVRFMGDLCTAMAIPGPVLEHETELADEPVVRSEAHARVGHYRQAAKLALQVPNEVQRLSMAAAYQRIRGAYLRSLWLHLAALRMLYAKSEDNPGLRGSVQIEYVNWYAGARRTWAGALIGLIRRALRAALASAIVRAYDPVELFWAVASDEAVLNAHPHAVAHLERAYRNVAEYSTRGPIPEILALRHTSGSGPYIETDSVVGYINDERNHRIADLREGHTPTTELLELLEKCRLVEDRPGEIKAQLLLRWANGPAKFPADALRDVEWTALAKIAFGLRWLRAGIARRRATRKAIRLGP